MKLYVNNRKKITAKRYCKEETSVHKTANHRPEIQCTITN